MRTPFAHILRLGPLGRSISPLHLLAEFVDVDFDSGLIATEGGVRKSLGQVSPPAPMLLLFDRGQHIRGPMNHGLVCLRLLNWSIEAIDFCMISAHECSTGLGELSEPSSTNL